jgi:hypothetical protein
MKRTSALAVAHMPPLPSMASVVQPSPPWQKAVRLLEVGFAADDPTFGSS